MSWYHFLPESFLEKVKKVYEHKKESQRLRIAQAYLQTLASNLSNSCLRDIDSVETWNVKRKNYRDQLAWMIGLNPFPEITDLRVNIAGKLAREKYSIEKVVFQSMPGLFVTANFYLPHQRNCRLPCIIYLNGHHASLLGAKTGFQDRYLWYPANGFALLVIDPLGFGEIPGIHRGLNCLNMWEWLATGYTPAGVEVWNAMRAIDWLETRQEVNPTKIGVTGISGGGVMTHFLAAIDDRVAVAAPSCSTYTIGTQVTTRSVSKQCDCTFYPNVFGLDFPVVDALIAPRPLLILGGRKDPTFPPSGFRQAYNAAKQIYDLYTPELHGWERLRLVESNEGHTDPPKFLKECQQWMVHWLESDSTGYQQDRDENEYRLENPDVLTCLERIPSSAINFHIHDVWLNIKAPSKPQTREEWENRKLTLKEIINGRIFCWMPDLRKNRKIRILRQSGGYVIDLSKFSEFELQSEGDTRIRVQLIEPKSIGKETSVVVWVRGVSDKVNFPDIDEVLPILSSTIVVTVSPRFTDFPLSASLLAQTERTAALLGRSIFAMQVCDVLITIHWIREKYKKRCGPIVTFGRGDAGISGLYAAFLDGNVEGVVLRNPPTTHKKSCLLPTILRDTDLCETAALLAPSKLCFIGEMPSAFNFTHDIYRIIGHEKKCYVKPSLAEAVFELKNCWMNQKGECDE